MTISFQSVTEKCSPRKVRGKRLKSILREEDRRRRCSRQKQNSTSKIDVWKMHHCGVENKARTKIKLSAGPPRDKHGGRSGSGQLGQCSQQTSISGGFADIGCSSQDRAGKSLWLIIGACYGERHMLRPQGFSCRGDQFISEVDIKQRD
jgi:hypothetical protein